jgi:Family of unknown function (DUF6518)
VPGIVVGALSLLLMNQGYGIVSAWRGIPYSGGFWMLAALVVGPVIGLAAVCWRAHSETLRALAGAVPSAILIGEGVYGLVKIADTTSPVYWIASIAGGVAILTWTVLKRVSARSARLLAIVATAVSASAFFFAYSAL